MFSFVAVLVVVMRTMMMMTGMVTSFGGFRCLATAVSSSPSPSSSATPHVDFFHSSEASRQREKSRCHHPSVPFLPRTTTRRILDLRGGGSSSSSSSSSSSGGNAGYNNPLSWFSGAFGRIIRSRISSSSSSSKSVAQVYRESLEEQVELLDRQLRQARDEVATLREKVKESKVTTRALTGSSSSRIKKTSTRDSSRADEEAEAAAAEAATAALERQRQQQLQQQRQEQEDKLARLQKEVRHLEDIKSNLEGLLVGAAQKIAELEAKLFEEESLSSELQIKYGRQLEQLQKQLETKQRAQLVKLEEMYRKQIQDAVEKALQEQEVKVQQQMAHLTEELQLKHLKELEEERQRSAHAIEAERKKLRRLVQALAVRERKLMQRRRKQQQQQQQQQQQYSEPEDGDGDGGSSGAGGSKNNRLIPPFTGVPLLSVPGAGAGQKPRTAPTTRGPI